MESVSQEASTPKSQSKNFQFTFIAFTDALPIYLVYHTANTDNSTLMSVIILHLFQMETSFNTSYKFYFSRLHPAFSSVNKVNFNIFINFPPKESDRNPRPVLTNPDTENAGGEGVTQRKINKVTSLLYPTPICTVIQLPLLCTPFMYALVAASLSSISVHSTHTADTGEVFSSTETEEVNHKVDRTHQTTTTFSRI
jgi:hypothetical protein